MAERKCSPLQRAIGDYLDHLLVERGLADSTLDSYRRDLLAFAAFLAENGVTQPRNIDSEDVLFYLASLRTAGLSAATVARRGSALRGFGRFLQRQGQASRDFARDLHSLRPGQSLPGVLTVPEIEALLRLPDLSTPLGLRDQAMLELGYGCALRVSELISLTLYELDMENSFVRCLGKGDRERIVPLGDCAAASIRDYLAHGRDLLLRGGSSQELFLNHLGSGLSRSGWWRILHSYGQRLGLDVHPHTLRHSAATHMLDNGADLRIIQEFLGHSSIATTQIYTNLSKSQLKSVYLQYHPRKRPEDIK